jgi:hypothetical protein
MADILNHPWIRKDDCATIEEIQHDFQNRKAKIEAENEQKRLQKEYERQQQMVSSGAVGRR